MRGPRLLVGGAAAGGTPPAHHHGGGVTRGGGAAQARPGCAPPLDRQGNAFAKRGRETGDVTYYNKADAVYRRVLQTTPGDLPATIGLGALELSRHDFRGALALGRRAVELSRTTAAGYGVVGDALLELGRYENAFDTFNTMVSLKPSVSSYARISYARELLGDVSGAADAMRLAVDAASGEPEALAWSHTQLGKLFWAHGKLGAAVREYHTALRVRPHYVSALDALAQVEAARGRVTQALSLSRRAAELLPLPQYVANYGDLLRHEGDPSGARRQYRLVAAIGRLQRAGGVNVDLELALFDIDHGVRLDRVVALARTARTERPSIDGDDTLAWALARTGRCGEALRYSKRALRLGTLDAPKFFHRGVIERCLGRSAAEHWFARARATNPYWRQP